MDNKQSLSTVKNVDRNLAFVQTQYHPPQRTIIYPEAQTTTKMDRAGLKPLEARLQSIYQAAHTSKVLQQGRSTISQRNPSHLKQRKSDQVEASPNPYQERPPHGKKFKYQTISQAESTRVQEYESQGNNTMTDGNNFFNQRRATSNPRSYMRSRLRQHQEIKEAVESQKGKNGRSKSRKSNPHHTIDDIPNDREILEFKAASKSGRKLAEQNFHTTIGTEGSFTGAPQRAPVNYPKKTMIDDYQAFYNNYSIKSGQQAAEETQNDLEKLITEKLNKRYNSRKKQQAAQNKTIDFNKQAPLLTKSNNSRGREESNIESQSREQTKILPFKKKAVASIPLGVGEVELVSSKTRNGHNTQGYAQKMQKYINASLGEVEQQASLESKSTCNLKDESIYSVQNYGSEQYQYNDSQLQSFIKTASPDSRMKAFPGSKGSSLILVKDSEDRGFGKKIRRNNNFMAYNSTGEKRAQSTVKHRNTNAALQVPPSLSTNSQSRQKFIIKENSGQAKKIRPSSTLKNNLARSKFSNSKASDSYGETVQFGTHNLLGTQGSKDLADSNILQQKAKDLTIRIRHQQPPHQVKRNNFENTASQEAYQAVASNSRYQATNITDDGEGKDESFDGQMDYQLNKTTAAQLKLTQGSGHSEYHSKSRLERTLESVNRMQMGDKNNLSKSIIIHHNKNASLINATNRYNESLLLEAENEDDEDQDYSSIKLVPERDHSHDMQQNAFNMVQTIQVSENNGQQQYRISEVKGYSFSHKKHAGDHYDSQISGHTAATSFYHNQASKVFVPMSSGPKHVEYQSSLLTNTAGQDQKSSFLQSEICSSFEQPPPANHTDDKSMPADLLGKASSQRRTTNGQNALLSMLSQDDYTRLKQEIHTHIDKIGGKIDEIPAIEEEDQQENLMSDDEQVILTVREKVPAPTKDDNSPKMDNIDSSRVLVEEDVYNIIDESPRQNTKYLKTT